MRLIIVLQCSLMMMSSAFVRRYPLASPRNRHTSSVALQGQKIAIVGGGLAGMGTLFHLLDQSDDAEVTVFDRAPVGTAGASSVAGGLVHPLSPRGKLVHWGLEGLAATNLLVEVAARDNENVILRNEIFRLAMTEENRKQLLETAERLPDLCEWIDELPDNPESVLGALRLHNGCRTIHVPSYLQSLWNHCRDRASWKIVSGDAREEWKHYDAVILAAGAGLFDQLLPLEHYPVQLVRGQSIELKMEGDIRLTTYLSGKYMSPLPGTDRILVGATHEFKRKPLDAQQVKDELYKQTRDMAPSVWEEGVVDRVTEGFRVQSNRGPYGRLPIVGRLDGSNLHPNTWLFTGLSSRGLLYHALYGEMMASAVLHDDPTCITNRMEALSWWKS